MKVVLDRKKLIETSKDFFNLFHTSISIWNHEGIVQAGYHNEPYCMYVWDKIGNNICLDCDVYASKIVKKTGKSYSYTCHAMIHETVAPVYHDDTIIAYICFGQYVNIDHSPTEAQMHKFCEEHNMDYKLFKEKYDLLPKLTTEQIVSATNIMIMCIHKLILEQSIKLLTEPVLEKITQHIEKNLAEPITIHTICKHFFISKNKLYKMFLQHYNITVQKYITLKRLARAEALLKESSDSVAIISEKVGFNDYNNFIKLFKKQYGLTPLQYKKANKIK